MFIYIGVGFIGEQNIGLSESGTCDALCERAMPRLHAGVRSHRMARRVALHERAVDCESCTIVII